MSQFMRSLSPDQEPSGHDANSREALDATSRAPSTPPLRDGLPVIEPAAKLPARLLEGCAVYPCREGAMASLPPGGTGAELGVLRGVFTRFLINAVKPAMLHAIDIDLGQLDRRNVEDALAAGRLTLHEGHSPAVLDSFPAGHFDWIYVDADHSYQGVCADARAALRALKPGGLIIFNDYTNFSPLEGVEYGVMRAVNELAIRENLRVAFFALHPWGYHDIALRKPGG